MAQRVLEITLISAWDLEDVHLFSKMEVYAVIFISGEHRAEGRTQTDSNGGRNPSWKETFFFIVPESGACDLCIVLRTDHALGYSDVGEVRVPLKELFGGGGGGGGIDAPGSGRVVSYPVRKIDSGEQRGLLDFSYELGERIAQGIAALTPADDPATVYPAGADAHYPAPPPYQPPESHRHPASPQESYGYPSPQPPYPPQYPPPGSYGYSAPPQCPPPVLYGYPALPQLLQLPPPPPPPQVSYGYPAPPPPPVSYRYPAPPPPHGYLLQPGYVYQPQPGYGAALQWPRRNNFGMRLGAGLVSDDAPAYNAGFGDGGGFHGWIDRGFGF